MGLERAPTTTRAVAQFALAGLVVLALFLGGRCSSAGPRAERRAPGRPAVCSTHRQGIVEPPCRTTFCRATSGRSRNSTGSCRSASSATASRGSRSGPSAGASSTPTSRGRSAGLSLDDEKLDVLRTGDARAELSSLEGAENRYERGLGEVYEVYLPIRAPDGTPLVFETYQRSTSRPPGAGSDPVRSAPARQPLPAVARAGAARVAACTQSAPQPGGSRAASRARARSLR